MREPLELEDLTQHKSALAIRIWYDYSLHSTKELFEFRLVDGSWQGRYYYFIIDRDPETYLLSLKDSYMQALEPKYGWPEFASKIEHNQIVNLQDIDIALTATHGILDGTHFLIEIVDGDGYQRHKYHCPEFFPESEHARRVVAFLDYLDIGFGVKTIRDKPGMWAQRRRWRRMRG